MDVNTLDLDSGCRPVDRRIFSGGPSFTVNLNGNQIIQLHYSDRLPSDPSNLIIRLSIGGIDYLAPLEFIKELPLWASLIMLFTEVCFFASLVYLLISLIREMRGFRVRAN